ncbi:MAG: FKBP-type peptidyl-prolyl cis-trans isomerase [Flavobacteriales bacterium]|nr:FKBP-type peptidyl-prolyl cis-trans isomerase [Flavobacteriales bacterium]
MRISNVIKSSFILVAILFNFSCSKETTQQDIIDDEIINDYIQENNLTTGHTNSGIYYTYDSVGTGAQPLRESNVTVAYTGYLVDGTVFDQSTAAGVTFNLRNVIEGWQEGIPLYKEGGAGTLLIPSRLGYGSQETGAIPANSVLIFDIHLIEVL